MIQRRLFLFDIGKMLEYQLCFIAYSPRYDEYKTAIYLRRLHLSPITITSVRRTFLSQYRSILLFRLVVACSGFHLI
jgi:hypothetical protein